ncbi:hypothetical protein LLG46_01170 [bacterium]|nr:hypothetical protein [bacterium]
MRNRNLIIPMLFFTMACSSAYASKVTVSRILREHKIQVVTTEKLESISKYLFRLGVRNESYITTTNLLIGKGRLKDKDSLLFVIDREKARRLIDEEKKLLPYPPAAVDAGEVLLYAAKASGRNGWEIIVSAPNEKWLNWELDRLCKSNLDLMRLEERGSILDRYQVKRLCVISNASRQLADDWVSRQLKPGRDTIDWQYIQLDSGLDNIDPDMDLLYIINKGVLGKNSKSDLPDLPVAMRSWLDSDESTDTCGAAKQSIVKETGNIRTISALAAPCERQLKSVLAGYPSVDSIPQALSTTALADLGKYRQMIVISRAGDRSDKIPTSAIDDLAGKMTSALAEGTGFECVGRQDLKELIYMALLHQKDGNLDSDDIMQIRKAADGARALAVVDVAAYTTQTDYSANTPRCRTSALAPFSESEPSRPHEPDPNERKFGIFGAHKYSEVDGSRSNDPDFIRDHRRWEEDMHDYRRDHDRWEHRKRDYEQARLYHQMDWEVSIDSTQTVRVSGNLRIYDIGELDSDCAGKVIFSCSLDGVGSRSGLYWSDHVNIQGEQNKPSTPSVPRSTTCILDQTVASEAFGDACKNAVDEMFARAILPMDTINVVAGGSVTAQ